MQKVLLLLVVLFVVTSAFATMNGDNLLIPKTAVAPVIDGELDDVWYSVTFTPTKTMVAGNATYTENWYGWFDTFVGIRMMYDDTKLYMYYEIYDDIIPGENEDVEPWEYDSLELFLDGDDSKTDNAYDGYDDVQFRFIYMWDVLTENESEPGFGWGEGGHQWDGMTDAELSEMLTPATESVWTEKVDFSGANLEIALDLEAWRLEPQVGSTFGYDLQYNDNDEAGTGPRVCEWKWWSTDGGSWHYANLFGTVEWDDYVTDEFLNVPKATAVPVIDGELDEAWDAIPEFSAAVYVKTDGSYESDYTVDGEPFMDNIDLYVEDWNDCWPTFRVMWDDEYFYLYLNVVDQYLHTDGDAWNADCVELYFDGDNSKNDYIAGDGYDDNDKQLRWVADNVAIAEGTEAVSSVTDSSWTYEIAIPFTALNFEPAVGADFGFEVQVADNDGEDWSRETIMRWWCSDNNSYNDASLFGNAYFGDVVGTCVGVGNVNAVAEDAPAVAQEFSLAQNYPNPFNPTTNIEFSVAKTSNVRLTVYDMLGQEVAELVNDVRPAGSYTVAFNGMDLASGMYIYKLEADNNIFTNKMMLIK